MKSFIYIALIAIAASLVVASPAASKPEDSEVQASAQVQAATDLTRLRKSAYGGSSGGSSGGHSIPAPPCPKNYLFSCQPNLAPVPCSSPSSSSSYGSQQGAYSAPVPSYIAPIRGNYGYPQAYARSFVPQALHYNQYYQY